MSWVGVGPMTTRYLGDYGATVVRLDSSRPPRHPSPDTALQRTALRASTAHSSTQTSTRRSWAWDSTSAQSQGQVIARRLAAWADVVVESFTPHTLRRLDLDYDALQDVNPSLVMLSTCMQGQTGPRADYRGFGNLMAAMSGYYHVTGWPDRDPVVVYGAYTDFICQRFCTTALVSAVDHQRRTGEGQHIDLSQFEAALQFLGPELLEYETFGTVAGRHGNRDARCAPHGIYPCQGEEQWVAIACTDDDRWDVLRAVMGNPSWAADARFDTLDGRKHHEDELDERVADWTASLSVMSVVEALQPAVAAGPVHNQSALYDDPQISHLGYFEMLEHPVIGEVPYNGMQARRCRRRRRISARPRPASARTATTSYRSSWTSTPTRSPICSPPRSLRSPEADACGCPILGRG